MSYCRASRPQFGQYGTPTRVSYEHSGQSSLPSQPQSPQYLTETGLKLSHHLQRHVVLAVEISRVVGECKSSRELRNSPADCHRFETSVWRALETVILMTSGMSFWRK